MRLWGDSAIEISPVLEKVFDSKIYRLVSSLSKKDRLEASGIQLFQNHYYVVFDNLSTIAKLHISLEKHHPDNKLIPGQSPEEQFEDIAYSPARRRFYVVIENAEFIKDDTENIRDSSKAKADGFKPKICEFDGQFNLLETHPVDFVFAVKNKGLEGLAVISRDHREYVLGLCEAAGNRPEQGSTQPEQGIGNVLVLKKQTDRWSVEHIIQLPRSVQFGDYAGLDIQGNRIAIVSQVSSTLWVGQFKDNSWEFADDGKVYPFPRSKTNKLKYCNLEGVTWIDGETIAVVSDKRKSIDAGRCKKKDQSIHVFKLPI